VLAVKVATGVTAFLLVAALCASQAAPTRTSAWHYPDDRKAIRSQEPPKPYKATGLPDGTVSVFTRYRSPGSLVPHPEGRGFWEFASVAKLYYHGRLFAIVGTAVDVDKNVQDGINGRFMLSAWRNGIYEWSNGLCETARNWSLSSPHFVFGLSLP
jgi:hypothetical protein